MNNLPLLSSLLVSLLVGFVAFYLALLPILHHFRYGLRERREQILGQFSAPAALAYFEYFYRRENHSQSQVLGQLQDEYDRQFGRQTFQLPYLLLVCSLAVAIIVMILSVVKMEGYLDLSFRKLGSTDLYALVGAYLYVTSDFLTRYRQRDFVPSALYWATFRLIFAIPLASSITFFIEEINVGSHVFSERLAAALAFGLGVFPTATLFLVLRRKIAPRLGLTEYSSDQEKPELEAIEGVNIGIVEKFQDVGVTTMLQLAYEDPIQLAMRTNLSFKCIVSAISQALLYIYLPTSSERPSKMTLPKGIAAVRKAQLPGAIEAANIYEDLTGETWSIGQAQPTPAAADWRPKSSGVLQALAKELDVTEDVAEQLLRNVWANPNTRFLREISRW